MSHTKKKSLKIPKGLYEFVNGRRTDNTMAKRSRTDNTMAKRQKNRQHNGQKTEKGQNYKQLSTKHYT
jgi:hypothetical protein